ncbi:hypothetical protein F7725_023866 [Dissostichus mawsoni]|uniref:Fibronectin type-III domain-containing protein n=1 Tax=Dissostichus mawsoni TaxID=36200 RepID=A0A7J5XXP8_DISMA|nr:hypothetical protein F7725_023866 [Dissostichus mawsoni]
MCLSSSNLTTMCRLLLGAVLLGHLGVCSAAQDALQTTEVRFDSVDYRHVVHWTPPGNSSSLQYYVQWKIYGDPDWLDVDGCQRIQKPQCDLSALTSDLREWYYARVHASSPPASKSAWTLSPRFSPRSDTKISSPVLRLNRTVQGIVVRVKPPRLLVRKMHDSLQYKIYLIHSSGEEQITSNSSYERNSFSSSKTEGRPGELWMRQSGTVQSRFWPSVSMSSSEQPIPTSEDSTTLISAQAWGLALKDTGRGLENASPLEGFSETSFSFCCFFCVEGGGRVAGNRRRYI